MRNTLWILCFIIIYVSNEAQSQTTRRPNSKFSVYKSDPAKDFLNPPESAKPGVMWMWMGSNLSKKGITKDLEALKEEGFNYTTMFSLSDITTPWSMPIKNDSTPEIIAWTEPWWKLVRFAAEESKRLGMHFGMFNGPSYESSGGNWITPELSMQEICWSKRDKIKGDFHVNMKLAKPEVDPHAKQSHPVYNPETGVADFPIIAARRTYYRDIAVLAVPSKGTVTKNQVIDISDKMSADGELNWEVPAGEWTVYRFGHTTRGTLIQPAQWQATGMECDKMSAKAVNFHMDHVIGEIQKHVGDLIGKGFNSVHFDSYEAGTPTWTPKMLEEFSKRRGYDLLSYLPTFAGRRIGSVQDSSKVKDDFSATIKDLYRDVYFSIISKKLKAANITLTCEPYGGPWRQEEVLPMIPLVMVEFWTNGGKYTPYELKPTVAALRKSGQNIIQAEALTGQPQDSQWDETPAWMKPIVDAAFCDGVNRLIVHRFVQQAFDDRYLPGASMGQWGTHFDRTQTWWKPAKAMVKYWQRCQALLQWGHIAPAVKNDFVVSDTTSSIELKNIHRQDGNTDIYFVANLSQNAGSAFCKFKVAGKQPEIWDPLTETMRNLPDFREENGSTSIKLDFEKAQSFFIVFRNNITKKYGDGRKNFASLKDIATLKGSWKVQFDSKWGGPEKEVDFHYLKDWTTSKLNGIKYFSGTAVYKKTFSIKETVINGKTSYYIDLGEVKHIARVNLNGSDLGVVWTAPWHAKIPSGVLKAGGNQLTVEVTNVWANRLIGDEQEPADCIWTPGYYGYGSALKEFPEWFLKNEPRPSSGRYCFTTWNYFTKDSPLIPSGLLGPVRIMSEIK